MTTHKIAAYAYPTIVAIVDDNKRFLNKVCFKLDEQIAYRLYEGSDKALNYFTQEYKFNPIVNRCLSANGESNIHLAGKHGVNFDIAAIHQEIYNPRRFNEIAVVIVDYNMPGLNGLEFCKAIKHLPVKKILVTRVAGENVAIQAFNDGDIHKFILKDTSNFEELINQSIVDLRQRYFQEISEGLIKPLVVDRSCVLGKPSFSEFFYDFCQQQQIVEFYLYDASGSFLLLDANGNTSWLVVKNAVDLDDYYDLACDSGASATVLDYLKEGKMLPFFPRTQDLERVKGQEWEKYLYPAKRLKADQAFFYAVVANKNQFLPERDKILSYNDYVNRVWPH